MTDIAPLAPEDILIILGNGNMVAGSELLQKLAYGLAIARQKHKWGYDEEVDTWHRAEYALKDEVDEWVKAMCEETPQRQNAEALDVMIVAARIANREWE